MKLGIVGLPNVGKSTLFNSLTKAGAGSANYPFCTIEPNIGIVEVPDMRLYELDKLYHTKKITPAVIEFVDIAGLVKGASKGEGLGNQFLANIREVDAIIHVVRAFDDDNIIHVDGSVDPKRDIECIELELIFSDMDILNRRIDKVKRGAHNNKDQKRELELLERIMKVLEEGKPASTVDINSIEEEEWFSTYNLLTAKPVIYAANVDENDAASEGEKNKYVSIIKDIAKEKNSQVFIVCAKIEEEISELLKDEKEEFLTALGIKESGLDKLIRASYSLLGLISYLTAGEDEIRAWTIKEGTKAPAAAGKIHTDFERGFIKAEVIEWDKLVECKNTSSAKEKGLVRLEGKEYIVKDGDVILFRFNV